MRIRNGVMAIVISFGLATSLSAEWNQYGGPGRDFRAAALELPSTWAGPGIVWERELGPGYSGIVVAGERLVTMTREGTSEVVVALDAQSGRTVWRDEYPAPIPSAADVHLDTTWGEGPNGTPLLVGDRVYTLGFTGVLSCMDARTGERLWRRQVVPEGVEIPFFGLSTSPIRHQDSVIVIAGGARAFDLESGEPRWVNDSFDASYASPVLFGPAGSETLVAGVAGEVVGLDPRTGEFRWRHEHANEHRTILSSPVVGDDDLLFVSAYFLGSIGLRVAADGSAVEELWEESRLQVSYTNAVRLGDTVYAFHNSILKALDLASGEILWQSRAAVRGNLLAVGERVLLLDAKGGLSLLALDREGVEVLANVRVLDGRSWTAPTLVGRRLYARNLETIVAIDLDRLDEPRAGPLEAAAPTRVEAPQEFLDAKAALFAAARRSDDVGLLAAEQAFERWTDEASSLAHLAHYYVGFGAYHRALLAGQGGLPLAQRAERHLVRATELDRNFAEAHAILGRIFPMYYRLDPARAAIAGPLGREHADRALDLAPRNPRAIAFRARSLFFRSPEHGGDPERGLDLMREALDAIAAETPDPRRAEPDWGRARLWLWYGEMLARVEGERELRAEDAYRRALEVAPDFTLARSALESEG